MAIKKIDENLDVVDSILTKTSNIIKKHWLLIIFLLFCAIIYWAWNLPDVEYDETNIEQNDTYYE